MAVTAESFKARYPEFENASDDLVEETLARAVQLCPSAVWDDLADQGVEVKAAQLLALSPNARSMKLSSNDGSTVYDKEWETLRRIVSAGGRVI